MFSRLFNGLAAVVGALVVSQFPAFYDQYVQRLGGRLDQAHIQVERIETAARAERMTVETYVDLFATSERSPVRRQGLIMEDQVRELNRLRAAQAALAPARTVERPVRFARHMDGALARATLRSFRPAVPLNSEGAIYGAAGLLAGLMIAAGIERALAALWRRWRPA